jgi:hypothetical protein
VDKARLSSWNACSASAVHVNPSLDSKRVSGAAMAPYRWMNRL